MIRTVRWYHAATGVEIEDQELDGVQRQAPHTATRAHETANGPARKRTLAALSIRHKCALVDPVYFMCFVGTIGRVSKPGSRVRISRLCAYVEIHATAHVRCDFGRWFLCPEFRAHPSLQSIDNLTFSHKYVSVDRSVGRSIHGEIDLDGVSASALLASVVVAFSGRLRLGSRSLAQDLLLLWPCLSFASCVCY